MTVKLDTTIPRQFLDLVLMTKYLIDGESFDVWKEQCWQRGLQWEQHGIGWLAEICKITTSADDMSMPICVNVTWERIGPNKDLVAFYNCTSKVAHYGLIEQWVSSVFNRPTVNANNFHICLQALGHQTSWYSHPEEIEGPAWRRRGK